RGASLTGGVLRIVEGGEGDEFRLRLWVGKRDELRERKSIPGNHHRPRFNTAKPIHALLGAAHFRHEIVGVDLYRVVDETGDVDRPRLGFPTLVGVWFRVGFVGAELVEIIVARDELIVR